MRNFQTKANVGGGADSITATKYGAGEFNALALEAENAVLRSGLALLGAADGTGDVLTQLGQALFLNGTKATSFQAAGTADAITLTPISGSSGVVIPPDYTAIDGARINFIPTGLNTGNVTISWGQTTGTQLGTKKVLDEAGAELPAGTLTATRFEFVYDASADSSTGAWIITPWSLLISDIFVDELLHIQEQQSSGTDGGTFTQAAWQTRLINTVEVNRITGASLATNQITLPAGTYFIEAWANAHAVENHKIKLRNITDSTNDLIGSACFANNGAINTTPSDMVGEITIAGTKVFELQHFGNLTKTTSGFGLSQVAAGVTEIYSNIKIWKTA